MFDKKEFSMRLKELRKAKGLNQDKASEKLGLSIETLRNYEQSKSIPSIDVIADIADFYDVSTDYLIKGKMDTDIVTLVRSLPERKQKSLLSFLEPR